MPRVPRIDKPGLLYHVFARGIERRQIFQNDRDRYRFLDSLGTILTETGTAIHAFALLPNHFHLLLRRNSAPLSSVMRRLLTSYAIYFNRRHERVGHLFQNRYRSIVCQEDRYYLQLVRYIHLNPVRSAQVSLEKLANYPFCGHSYLLGNRRADWYEPERVLTRFGGPAAAGRQVYLEMIASSPQSRIALNPDDRGSNQTDNAADIRVESEQAKQGFDFKIEPIVDAVCDEMGILKTELLLGAKRRDVVKARELIVGKLIGEVGLPPSHIAKELYISKTAVTSILRRRSKRVS